MCTPVLRLGTLIVSCYSDSYLDIYDMVRNIVRAYLCLVFCPFVLILIPQQTGIGKGPSIMLHDGFLGLTPWKDFLPGADVCIAGCKVQNDARSLTSFAAPCARNSPLHCV